MFCTTQPWLKTERAKSSPHKNSPAERLMDINQNFKHTSLNRVSPVHAVSTVGVSFKRREREQT